MLGTFVWSKSFLIHYKFRKQTSTFLSFFRRRSQASAVSLMFLRATHQSKDVYHCFKDLWYRYLMLTSQPWCPKQKMIIQLSTLVQRMENWGRFVLVIWALDSCYDQIMSAQYFHGLKALHKNVGTSVELIEVNWIEVYSQYFHGYGMLNQSEG